MLMCSWCLSQQWETNCKSKLMTTKPSVHRSEFQQQQRCDWEKLRQLFKLTASGKVSGKAELKCNRKKGARSVLQRQQDGGRHTQIHMCTEPDRYTHTHLRLLPYILKTLIIFASTVVENNSRFYRIEVRIHEPDIICKKF